MARRKIARKRVNAAITALDKVRKEWMRRPGVSAVDVGYKISDKELTNELAVRVHVARKLPMAALMAPEAFNSEQHPQKLDGFPVDVIEAEYGSSSVAPIEPEALDRMGHVDPVIGGVSCGNPRTTAGTVGAIVWDRRDGAPCILSNWHVLCASLEAKVGEPIYQPGPMDGGGPADQVAELRRWRLDGDADAALARLLGGRGHARDLLGSQPLGGIEEAELGMEVVKSGRTTGMTEGIVDGLAASVRIDYGDKVQQFNDQIHIVPRPPWPVQDYEVSKGGDSGAVWVNAATGNAVGLHFAGERDRSPAAENAMANRMSKVAELLEFSVTPLFLPPPEPPDAALMEAMRTVLCQRFPELCASDGVIESAALAPLAAVAAGRAGLAQATPPTAGAPPSIEQLMAEIQQLYQRRR